MERLSRELRAGLSSPLKEELQKFLSKEAEEAQHIERALRMAIDKTVEDLGELEKSVKAKNKAWQMEKEELEAAIRTTTRSEQENVRLDLSILEYEIKVMSNQAKEERGKIASLEKSQQRVLSLLEMEKDVDELMFRSPERLKAESDNWIRWTQERVDSALSKALTTAAVKQKWLKGLKIKAEKCTVSDVSVQEASDTNMPSLIDVFQSCKTKKIAKLFIRAVNLQGDADREFQKNMARVMAEAAKQEKKIRAAELKERRQLEVKIRKMLERIQRAEIKEQKKKKKKEKKEAKKLAKKKEKEERAALNTPTKCSRFFFWIGKAAVKLSK